MCSRSAGGVEGGVKKLWRSEKRCSRSSGGVEGCVQEALEEWKEVFKKRYKD